MIQDDVVECLIDAGDSWSRLRPACTNAAQDAYGNHVMGFNLGDHVMIAAGATVLRMPSECAVRRDGSRA